MTTNESKEFGNSTRIQSIDVLRGLVMVLMVIDHVRVYSGIPAGSPELGIFFTRWITHFCAPGFAFFAGTSIFLYEGTHNRSELTRFLITRGLFLVLLEITLIRFFWSFNFNYSDFFLAGVIWMLGWCMVLMTLFIRLKPLTAGLFGIAIITFQQAFAYLPTLLPQSFQLAFGKFWEFIYPSGLQGIEGVTILYVIVPWIGVMAAGYGFGLVLMMEPGKRKKFCLRIGLACIALFVVIGSVLIYNKQPGENQMPFVLELLNQKKYPASALYILMTLGPIIALIPFAEKAKGWFANVLSVFGKVPMFFYLLHILIIHVFALIVNYFLHGSGHQEWYVTAPFTRIEYNYWWSLGLLYAVFLSTVIVLYFLCRWYVGYKYSNKRWWTSFL